MTLSQVLLVFGESIASKAKMGPVIVKGADEEVFMSACEQTTFGSVFSTMNGEFGE